MAKIPFPIHQLSVYHTHMLFRFILLVMLAGEAFAIGSPYTPDLPNPILEPWQWRAYPALEGYEIVCATEDKDGNLWFGTTTCILRYDDLRITLFDENHGLDGERVVAITTHGRHTLLRDAKRRLPVRADRLGSRLSA
ncbi:MAG: hypothetical protein CME19_04960 [Gemmatimonadetes bacterium]|nr:hypothetical protein [Gemmatimonadota bacterium]